jgi:hypothetical protein
VVRVSIESGAVRFPVPEIHMSCKRTTLAAVLAALPFSLLAAEPTLTPVVVTASKEQAPPLATTVDAAGVQALRAATSDTASLLRDVPGVSLLRRRRRLQPAGRSTAWPTTACASRSTAWT